MIGLMVLVSEDGGIDIKITNMPIKKIYLDTSVSPMEWVDENRSIIVEALYENIFDFLESEDETRTVLKVENKPTFDLLNMESYSVIFDFMLIRSDIDITIGSMLEFYESIEEYEKCAKLIQAKEKFHLEI